MDNIKIPVVGLVAGCTLMAFGVHAIDPEYARKLERSGCTQASELQGCDISKTKAENAKAGFGMVSHGHAGHAPPRYSDVVGRDSIAAIDMMSERGFMNVDSLESGSTQYGIFYHPASQLCVQLTMADGKVLNADDIQTHPNCH